MPRSSTIHEVGTCNSERPAPPDRGAARGHPPERQRLGCRVSRSRPRPLNHGVRCGRTTCRWEQAGPEDRARRLPGVPQARCRCAARWRRGDGDLHDGARMAAGRFAAHRRCYRHCPGARPARTSPASLGARWRGGAQGRVSRHAGAGPPLSRTDTRRPGAVGEHRAQERVP